MPLYTFYPLRPDGSSLMFASHDLSDDVAALGRVSEILREHGSATSVVIWCGERLVRQEEPRSAEA